MTEEQTTPAAAENTGTQQQHMIPKSRFDEVNTEYKRLKAAMEQQSAEQKAAADKRLAEQNEWKTLAEQHAARIAELEPLAQAAKSAQEALAATVQARIERLPEDVRDMVPDFEDARKTLAWLDANEPRLISPVAPDTDAGKRGDGGGATAKLNDTERYIAERLGLKLEDFAEEKQKSGKKLP